MSRNMRVLVVASILIASAAMAAGVVWWAEAHQVAHQYVFGVGLIVVGAAFTALYLAMSDDFLRRNIGEPGAAQTRRVWRSGWVGMLLGAVMLGVLYLDHRIKASAADAQSKAAFNRGLSAAEARDWQSAIDAFSTAIRLDPNNTNAWYNRGVAYARKKDNDRALTDFGEAIRLKPDYAKAYLARSWVYRQQGDEARAKADQQTAAKLDPSLEKSGHGNP